MIRRHIIFYGDVQGVGFRYRAYHAAAMYGIMEIQGEEVQIDRVIMAIERGTYVRIENMDCREMEVRDGESGFRIR